MNYTFRPLGAWTEKVTNPRTSTSRFKAKWHNTLALLDRELGYLDARHVVLQVDASEQDIRMDGMLRANARVQFPGVRLAFDSKHGPLMYATDAYDKDWAHAMPGWQANVRAIALGLEALRSVDRWGITRRAEQYQGWKAIGAGPATPMPARMTVEDAARFMCEAAGMSPGTWGALLDSITSGTPQLAYGPAYRMAARRLHPDAGGSNGDFQRLQEAKRILDQHAGVA